MPSLDTAASTLPGLDGPTLSSTLSFVARGSQARLAVQENVRRQPDSLWDWPTHRLFRINVSTNDARSLSISVAPACKVIAHVIVAIFGTQWLFYFSLIYISNSKNMLSKVPNANSRLAMATSFLAIELIGSCPEMMSTWCS